MATVLDVRALLDHLARDLMSEHETGRCGRAATHHVLVRAADVGGDDLQDDAMRDVLAVGRPHLRKVDGLHFHLAGTQIDNAAIAGHGTLLLEHRQAGMSPDGPSYKACAPASATA